MPSSRGSSQPRDWICIAGKFFIIWANIEPDQIIPKLKAFQWFPTALAKKFQIPSFESEKPQWSPLPSTVFPTHPTPLCSFTGLCSSNVPRLVLGWGLCIILQCVPSYLGRVEASGTLSDVTSSDDLCQKTTHSLTITATYCNSQCSSCYLLIDFLFISLVTTCPALWEENLCETAGIFQSTLFLVLACRSHATNTCCLNWKRTPDHQKWTKEPYLGGAFISTESQDCPTKICWCSEVHQPGQREWGETGQAQHKTLTPFLKDPHCLYLQRLQDTLEKERATHSSILA